MAVRRRRPLVPPPYPRRNRYTPLSSEQSPLVSVSAVSLRLIAKTALAPLPLLFPSQTLRWFVMGALDIWAKSALFASACGQSSQRPLSLLFPPQTLLWERCRLQRELHTGVFLGISGRISMEIVTHPGVGMCYNSMTFQVLVNFTISFTGVTLASSR